ncbi:ABC transporter ATP-binding protein [Paraherbaspirillum soli]|uniref:ABC transporter ATP-binding protein n=1 Tax=Paraherbaspirillum soli TaxID=631222 RepID=A0ABW0M5G9_9BURK
MATDSIIEIDNVWTQYGDTVIHRDLTLRVHSGEVMAIIGGSGSGKTTLLRLMLGLEPPSRGTIKVFGVPLQGCASHDLRQARNRWGVLFQEGALFSALSVYDNVALPLRELKALPEDGIREMVMMKLDLVEIDTMSMHKMPAELSGGMVKRVALARALALNPELLFLDEPTAGLDPERSHGFVQIIESLRRALNLTVVMVTHDVDTLMALSDRVAVLADQQLLTVGPLWKIVQHKDSFIQNFFLGQRKRCEQENIKDFRDKLAIN